MEKTNARHLTARQFPQPFIPAGLAVIDCSFISLRNILPAAIALLRPDGKIVALIKPQFEAGKAEADKGRGVISDPLVHERVLAELREFVRAQPGVRWRGVVESPLLGPAGNKEFLALIENQKRRADWQFRQARLRGERPQSRATHSTRRAQSVVRYRHRPAGGTEKLRLW
jgi:23S rRNA (cytidine1920-2'-O)/16S rRNA (cytidine1409-2'-O)-methyltransferase